MRRLRAEGADLEADEDTALLPFSRCAVKSFKQGPFDSMRYQLKLVLFKVSSRRSFLRICLH